MCWLFAFDLNNVVWINFWNFFHDPRSSSRSRIMVILVIHLQFHFSSPPLQFYRLTTHITLCTVTYHHACNMVMIKVILCAASLSLCYTTTCYGIDECIASCWCMGVSKNKDSTLHIQAERTQIQLRQPSLSCCFHEDCNIMAFRICINRFCRVGGKAIILIDFLFYTCIVGANPLPRMPITTQTKYCTVSMRSAWAAPISPNTLFESWTDTLQKSVQTWCIPFAL